MALPSEYEFEEWEWWWGPWRNFIRCGNCGALMNLNVPCPVCATDYNKIEPDEFVLPDGSRVSNRVFQGPLDWSPYVMLQMMHTDWVRPPPVDRDDEPHSIRRPSPRAIVVIIFWTYFEALMTWYYERATRTLPPKVAGDLLKRYSGIGARLDRLHRVLFERCFAEDLNELGYDDVWAYLERLQTRRNEFVHGNPEAIDDALVSDTARMIPRFHEGWIRAFNLRCARPPPAAAP